MPATIINGKAIAETFNRQTAARIAEYLALEQRPPQLAVVLVGQDPASTVYVKNKLKACTSVGMLSRSFMLQADTQESVLVDIIDQLNGDPDIDGILVQLPLPSHIDSTKIIERINPAKDVDGFHPYNIGRLAQKRPLLRPCTPFGIMKLLGTLPVQLAGLRATVVGLSNIVGRPMVLELLMAGCTVTACHSLTQNLRFELAAADLVVVALGKPHFIQGDWIKPGAVVIDVGINRTPQGKLVGDVEFDKAVERAGWITPVPGGIGPMTVATLLGNTLLAYQNRIR